MILGGCDVSLHGAVVRQRNIAEENTVAAVDQSPRGPAVRGLVEFALGETVVDEHERLSLRRRAHDVRSTASKVNAMSPTREAVRPLIMTSNAIPLSAVCELSASKGQGRQAVATVDSNCSSSRIFSPSLRVSPPTGRGWGERGRASR